jgi:hypothetical protein
MMHQFIKDGVVRTFEVQDGRVITSILIDGCWVCNPTIEQFLADGRQEYIPPTPEPYLPSIEELVEGKLRERYTINQEFEVNRKRDTEPQAFQAYYDYVEECIEWANEQPHREEATNG